jgi:hypothetical protein
LMQSCAGHVILPPGASLSSVSQFLFFGIPQFQVLHAAARDCLNARTTVSGPSEY